MKTTILVLSLFAAPFAQAESCMHFKKCYKVTSEKGGDYAASWGFTRGSTFIFDQNRCDSLEFTFLKDEMFNTTKWKTDGACHHDGEGRITIDDEKVLQYGYSKGTCPKLSDQPESEIAKGEDGKLTYFVYDEGGKVAAQATLEPTDKAPKWMQDGFSCK